jgi:hypothetical protein
MHYRPGLAAKAAGQKPAGRPRSRQRLSPFVTVSANARKKNINRLTLIRPLTFGSWSHELVPSAAFTPPNFIRKQTRDKTMDNEIEN